MKAVLDREHVLLVDDDDMSRFMAAESLSHAGFKVSDVASGEEALTLFEQNEIDLVLLDVMMPGIDGYTVCQRLRQHPRGGWLPILMLTGLNDTESIERAYIAGATDFITKPINWLLLTQRVRYGLRTSRAIREVSRSQRSLAQAQHLAHMGNWEWSIAEARFSWSAELKHIFGSTLKLAGSATPEALLQLVRKSDRDAVRDARRALLQEGREYQLTYGIERLDGSLRELFEQAVAVRDASGAVVRVEGITQDITERVEAQRRIEHLAMHDSLTGLANRQFFGQLAETELERARREKSNCAILTIDVDHFKSVNDALGDAAGDQLLRTIATRLLASVRSEDLLALHPPIRVAEMVARIDGDAFTTLLLDVRAPEQAALVAQRLQQAVAQPLSIDGRELVLTASVGIAFFPRDADSIETLSRHAEQALYAAKAIGPANYCFFNEEMNAAARYRLQFETELRQAIARNELLLHFQPKVDVATGRLTGAEALVRWQHPQRGLLGPGQFIPLAEECGLIVALGDWVAAAAVRQIRHWLDAGLPPVRVSINLASPSFQEESMVDKLCALVHAAGVSPHCLMLELTESLLMIDANQTISRLNRLRSEGFGLSLDDFGTGYSSLSYLRRFPLDELKIDRSFVTDITKGHRDAAIALSIIELGQQFDMHVVAEGVETQEQANFLLGHRCSIQQGFLFSPPVPAERFAAILRDGGIFDPALCHSSETADNLTE